MPVMSKVFLALGAVFAALAVALSAAAAHVPALHSGGAIFTASLTQHAFHALGLMFVGVTLARRVNAWLVASGTLMVAGLLLFCLNVDARILWGWNAARALVPVGGGAFILAWLAFAVGVWRPGSANAPVQRSS